MVKSAAAVAEAPGKSQELAPDMRAMLEQDAGAGLESVTVRDLQVPYITILQSGSPQCKEAKPEYIPEARPGMLYNTATQALYSGKEGIRVIPVRFMTRWVEWKPRESGGGFVKDWGEDQAAALAGSHMDDRRRYVRDGNYIVETATFYVLLPDYDTKGIISMTSTQLKKARGWNTRITDIKAQRADGSRYTPGMHAHVWKMTTVPESNDSGDWYGWKIEFVGPTIEVFDPNRYMEGREFGTAAKTLQIAPPQSESGDTEIPF